MIERKYVGDCLIEVLGLIQQGLSVEGSDVFIEIDGEEVEWSLAGKSSLIIVLQDVVIVVSGFCSKRSNLLVAAGIAWNEEDWYSLDLCND